MATVKEKIEYLEGRRDHLAMLFLQESLSKGKTITIPSLDIQIVPVRCGECDGVLRREGDINIVCEGPKSSDTPCPYGKGETVEKSGLGGEMERVSPDNVELGSGEYPKTILLPALTKKEKYKIELLDLKHRQSRERARTTNYILGGSMKPLNPKATALLEVKHFREEMHLEFKYSERSRLKKSLAKAVVWALCPIVSLGIRLRYINSD